MLEECTHYKRIQSTKQIEIRIMIRAKHSLIIPALFILLSTSKFFSQTNLWSSLSTGINGNVNALVVFNTNIVAAGGFSNAGGVSVNNIAMWNGTSWQALGQGLNDTVYALAVFNGELIAGGRFSNSDVSDGDNIARWNGTSWQPLGQGTDGDVKALIVFNSQLIAGGEFDNAGGQSNTSRIAKWNGSNWSSLGSGISTSGGSRVSSLTIFNTELIAAGKFSNAGGTSANNIARWNGSSWGTLGTGISGNNDRVFSAGIHNSELYVGGRITIAGGISVSNLAKWNGTVWSNVGNGTSDEVYAIASFTGELIVGGSFKYAGTLYVDRIAKWNGTVWSRMETGMNNKVKTLLVNAANLYAGGEFGTSGGRYIRRVALWNTQATSTVSGQVRYSDNNQLVPSGKVYAVRYDVNTREFIIADSTTISNGDYVLPRVPRNDTLRVIIFPDDEFDFVSDFVPTYFPSTVDWVNATRIFASTNLVNLNVSVFRITTSPVNNSSANISGYVYLNIMPPLELPTPYPYLSDAIVYAKQGNVYRRFSRSADDETYSLNGLPLGIYEIYVNRLGYKNETRQIILGITNLDTVNFYLDTSNVIGIVNISNEIPSAFELYQNYPNPFNPETKIKFRITKRTNVNMTIFDVNGRQVTELVNEELNPGTYEVSVRINFISSGVYFYRLTADEFTRTKKMIMLK